MGPIIRRNNGFINQYLGDAIMAIFPRSADDAMAAAVDMQVALEQFNLEPIATAGETFDPELMEVVEVVGDSGKPAGEVLEEVRRGYWRGEVVFRYAQVKVAR